MATVSVANNDVSLSGNTLVTAQGTATVAGLWTFDRDPSAPFAVSAGSAVVTNLDADKLDGLEASAFVQDGATSFTVGDGASEDIQINFDGDSQDYYLGIDDGTNVLTLGVGSVMGTTEVLRINAGQALNIIAALHLSGTITPATFSTNINDWNPTGLSTALAVRASSDASRNLSGIVAPTAGRILLLMNVGSFDIVLLDDATSTAANRFLCPGAANLTLASQDGVLLWYDTTSSRWRVVAP